MKLVLVGAGGYGETYLRLMDETLGLWSSLHAVVDPFVRQSSYYDRLVQEGIPLYDTLQAFYGADQADLVMIVSPIPLHEEQLLTAISHGSNVLCEKPLTATLQQARRMQAAVQASGLRCGVGFQLSFSEVMQAVKRDILSGKLGKPLQMKAMVSWPRRKAYYGQSSWKGCIRDAQGEWVLDSVATNATAHYLHNLFFLLGDTMTTARMPEVLEGSLYRAHEIESFDTCFWRGTFADGCTFSYTASHATDRIVSPIGEYIFENATVLSDGETGDVVAHWKDGTTTVYGNGNIQEEQGRKIPRMMEAIRTGAAVDCTIETALPHLTVCNAAFDHMEIHPFDEPLISRTEDGQAVAVPGLLEAMEQCHISGMLPDEAGYAWAAPSVQVKLAGIEAFEGRLYP